MCTWDCATLFWRRFEGKVDLWMRISSINFPSGMLSWISNIIRAKICVGQLPKSVLTWHIQPPLLYFYFFRVPQNADLWDDGALGSGDRDGRPWTGQSCLLTAAPPVSGPRGPNGRTPLQSIYDQSGFGRGHHGSPVLPEPNPLPPQCPHGERRGEADDQKTRVGGHL